MTTDVLMAQPRSFNAALPAELFRRHPLFAGAALYLVALAILLWPDRSTTPSDAPQTTSPQSRSASGSETTPS